MPVKLARRTPGAGFNAMRSMNSLPGSHTYDQAVWLPGERLC
jgi:hypothetical protein